MLRIALPDNNPNQGAHKRVQNPISHGWFMARDNLIRLVQLSFWAVVVFSVVLFAGAQTGGFGVPAALGAILFLIIMSSAMVSRRSASEGTARHGFLQGVMVQKQALFASMMQNKVGTLIILAILVAFVWLARTAV